MPTGYTAAIENGITFEQFALSCSRAFGALIEMRDEPLSAPIPEEFELPTYHKDALEGAQARLAELLAITPERAAEEAAREHEAKLESHRQAVEKKEQLEKKYRAMLDDVAAWVPPSEDHKELKEFMIRQLFESIKFDCDTSYLKEPLLLPVAEWLERQIKACENDVAYHTDEQAKDVERTKTRNEWLRALRGSLKRSDQP